MKPYKPAKFVLLALLFPVMVSAKSAVIGKDQSISSAYKWTGLYAGINAGVVKHTMDITDNQAVTFNATIRQVTDPSFTGGVQFGYRHQLNSSQTSGVFGLEISSNFAHAKSHQEYGSPFALYQLSSQHKLKNLTMAQLIVGIAADRTLLFLAAGLSWFDISGNVTNEDGIPFFTEFSVGKKALATAIGCGAEYAISDNISARIKVDVIMPETYSTLDNAGNNYSIANDFVQGTIGINYRFG
jgi:opacity protein-like surface antigen